jgi:hypothetical protein
LNATAAATCIVTATKAASTGYLAATSDPKTFTFTAVPVAQATLTVSNTTLTGTVGTAITLTTSGGSGDGAVTFTVTGAGCGVLPPVTGTSLNATAAATCIVTATKAASTGYLEATSTAKTFTFTAAPLQQATLRVTELMLMNGANTLFKVGRVIEEYRLETSGGSGGGSVTFAVTGTGCSIGKTGNYFHSYAVGTCIVTATKAASTGYLAATSTKTFTFTGMASQATLYVTTPEVFSQLTTAVFAGPNGSTIALSTSGGSGDGAVTLTLTDTACYLIGTTLYLRDSGTCIVTATKAASHGYLEATGAKTFTVIEH